MKVIAIAVFCFVFSLVPAAVLRTNGRQGLSCLQCLSQVLSSCGSQFTDPNCCNAIVNCVNTASCDPTFASVCSGSAPPSPPSTTTTSSASGTPPSSPSSSTTPIPSGSTPPSSSASPTPSSPTAPSSSASSTPGSSGTPQGSATPSSSGATSTPSSGTPSATVASPTTSADASPSGTAASPTTSADVTTSGTPASTTNPSPTLNTTAERNSSSSTCFPASSTVITLSGLRKMEELELGDSVMTSDGSYSPVFFFGHREPNTWHNFIELETENGKLTLSPSHYVYLLDGTMRTAASVQIGDTLVSASGKAREVTGLKNIRERGLFNPHTSSGHLVVDGFKVSCYTETVNPHVAHVLLAPLRALHGFGFIAGQFLDQDAPPSLAALAPRGSLVM
uniref:Hint domain-containing protein n=1 Tax=Compsopogon caeruleus TaxID=31354 RepID=A0A7S1T873_9RHOD|mmetsp:Transcript_12701/g.25777  ORF Transcript_12701/g.25777 Transcript_12701/m.25777 type:complete len:393 (+) Transcript_12701:216-1394(+)